MKLTDFVVGQTFACGGRLWRCTDKGSRVVVARLDAEPYGGELVFDEDDRAGCAPTLEAWREEFGDG